MAESIADIQFTPVSASNLDTYMEVGARSYCQHYTHLWENKDPSPYLRASFTHHVLLEDLANAGLAHYIISKNAQAVGILKIIRDSEIGEYMADKALLVEKLYLLRESSGQGIGRQALLFGERLARSLGKSVIWLDTMQSGPALGFYLKEGYEIAGERMLHFNRVRESEKPMYVLIKQLTP